VELTEQLEAAPDNIAPGWQGFAMAPSGGPGTRRGYHCRGQPGSAQDKPAIIDRQKSAGSPDQIYLAGADQVVPTRLCAFDPRSALLHASKTNDAVPGRALRHFDKAGPELLR
jgi:hypothetical protein